ncbi:MAG: type II toxin-antitoxin system HicB family antitoxin [Burkholderiaceae bacterium]|nr:type II toxin-antitoxin system HicB family antitoxin [Burkholderiaceae bacterium]
MRFSVVLHTDDGARFGVTVPDLPGCFSSGETFQQALDCVVEAIELHLQGLVEAGGKVPAPRFIAEHRSNPDFVGGVWATVEVESPRHSQGSK